MGAVFYVILAFIALLLGGFAPATLIILIGILDEISDINDRAKT